MGRYEKGMTKALQEKDVEIHRLTERVKELEEALEYVAVRWSPALDGYCWCSRKISVSEHKPFCTKARKALNRSKEAK